MRIVAVWAHKLVRLVLLEYGGPIEPVEQILRRPYMMMRLAVEEAFHMGALELHGHADEVRLLSSCQRIESPSTQRRQLNRT